MHKPANDPIFTFIEKKRGEGKSGKLAMVAGLNKFLRSDTSYPIGQCCVDIVNMDEEVLEPPAFWSVGCLTHKSESFRLRFVLFATVCSADLPLFPSSPARSNPVLGQKWVKENFTITNFEYAVYLLVYEILFFFSLSIKPVNKEETNTTVV